VAQTTADFGWTVTSEDDGAIVHPRGDFDVYWSPRFRDLLIDLVEQQGVRSLEIDLSGVTFVDSSALGVLIGIQRRLDERGGTLVLSHPSPSTAKAITVSGLAPLLHLAI
jgi:anti-sigma B factor antagonist